MTVDDVHWILILFICLFKNKFVFFLSLSPCSLFGRRGKKSVAFDGENGKRVFYTEERKKTSMENTSIGMTVMIADVFVDAGCTPSKSKWRESIVVKATTIQWALIPHLVENHCMLCSLAVILFHSLSVYVRCRFSFHSFNRLAEHWLNCHSNYILYQFCFIFRKCTLDGVRKERKRNQRLFRLLCDIQYRRCAKQKRRIEKGNTSTSGETNQRVERRAKTFAMPSPTFLTDKRLKAFKCIEWRCKISEKSTLFYIPLCFHPQKKCAVSTILRCLFFHLNWMYGVFFSHFEHVTERFWMFNSNKWDKAVSNT